MFHEGATIVTHHSNRAFYKQAWANPRTINPDRLAKSQKAAQFQTFAAEPLVLTDGKRARRGPRTLPATATTTRSRWSTCRPRRS